MQMTRVVIITIITIRRQRFKNTFKHQEAVHRIIDKMVLHTHKALVK